MPALVKQRLTVLAVIGAALYGNSYQQFRHFDPTDPRGADDALEYVRMSHGDYDVAETHRYRFIIPTLAGWLQPAIARIVKDPVDRDILSFYPVNFLFMTAAAWLFYYLLVGYGFSGQLALVGVLFFCGNRISALTTGTPLVDSAYYFAIAVVLFCTQRGRLLELALYIPLLALTKETIFPFFVFPFLKRRHLLSLGVLELSIVGAFGLTAGTRAYIGGLSGRDTASLCEVVVQHVESIRGSLLHLVSPAGLHDLQNGFSLLLLLAVIGWILHRRNSHYTMPHLFLLVIPLAMSYALLSGNLGRMFFAASFVIIPYALVSIESALGLGSPTNPSSHRSI